MDETPPENPEERSKLWKIFWVTLIGAPAMPFAIAAILPKGTDSDSAGIAAIVGWAGAIIGANVCGILLAKLTSKTPAQQAVRAVVFSLMFIMVFAICAFVGCALTVLK